MEKEHILLLIAFCFLLPIKTIAGANNKCLPASCGPHEPDVRFPFRIRGRQPDRCGYPGFDLSCNEQNRTTLRLQSSHSYIVTNISYISQVIYLDPEFCRPNRIVSLNPNGPPFDSNILDRYTFYNCSVQNSSLIYPNVRFQCLSSGNYSVIGALINSFYPKKGFSNCTVVKTITLPSTNSDRRNTLELMWFYPYYCQSCEKKGVSEGAKYALSIGIGLPAFICITGFACYLCSKAQSDINSHNQSVELSSSAIISRTGLDEATIESYPKTVLGDSYSLPNDDGTCAICLCDYKPKDSLRTIPDCNHYFHFECIDEWLKLNVTCPVCRNMPESLALVTPCSSASLSTSINSS